MTASDLTLDELRLVLAEDVAEAAIFDGWTDAAVESAAGLRGVNAQVAKAAYPGGAIDMIEAWIAAVDAKMAAAFAPADLAMVSVRERIRRLVVFRLEAIAGKEEALRRALSVVAMPQNAGRSLRLGWRSADVMWRLAGDVATDYNHYTKRCLLTGIYAATLAVYVDDDSEGKGDTLAFLDRRLADVMRFEKAKAQLLRPSEERFSVSRFLGRLRYPAN